jgi:hypothetical protein
MTLTLGGFRGQLIGATVSVADPAAGLLKYTKDEFCKC